MSFVSFVVNAPRRHGFHRPRDRRDVLGRRAAAPAHDVQQPGLRELAQRRRGLVRLLVVLAERVRQAGVRMTAHVTIGQARELGDIRPHLHGAERTVHADAERLRVRDAHPEGIDGLTR